MLGKFYPALVAWQLANLAPRDSQCCTTAESRWSIAIILKRPCSSVSDRKRCHFPIDSLSAMSLSSHLIRPAEGDPMVIARKLHLIPQLE